MGSFYAFNTTVEGYLHQKKNISREDISCEDASESYSDENGRFQIAVVADGHGDPACMRSAAGSRRAVEIAVECLKEFAKSVTEEESSEEYESIAKQLTVGKTGKRVMQQLTNTIISRWHSFVDADLCENPLTQEEKEKAGRYAEVYRRGDRLAHAYGTTLIAALRTPDFLMLLQQGDGRCDVFAEDGTVSQPIPWDDRCHENVTTSLCDEDVVTSIRSCVICFRDKKIISYSIPRFEDGYREEPWKGGNILACCLGSDGVEDSYRNMEGTHRFYRQLLCERIKRGKEGFETYLKEWLPDFSRKGSGDDVSVAGIVDMEQIETAAALFQRQNRRYDLEEQLARYESRQVSMSRKHEMLGRQSEAARIALDEKEKKLLDAYRNSEKAENASRETEKQLQSAEQEREQLMEQYNNWNYRRRMERNDSQSSWSLLENLFPENGQELEENVNRQMQKKLQKNQFNCQILRGKQRKQKKDLAFWEGEQKKREQERRQAEELYQKAKEEFAEYDREYWFVQTEMERIRREMDSLTDREGVEPVAPEEKEKSKELKSLSGYAKEETGETRFIPWEQWRARMAKKAAASPENAVIEKEKTERDCVREPETATEQEEAAAWEAAVLSEAALPEDMVLPEDGGGPKEGREQEAAEGPAAGQSELPAAEEEAAGKAESGETCENEYKTVRKATFTIFE